MNKSTIIILIISTLLWNCTHEKKKKKEIKKDASNIVVRESMCPSGLNPFTYKVVNARYICNNIYQQLVGFDPINKNVIPILAKERPIIEFSDSQTFIHYEIKKEAVWDDGKPITAKDVEFSLKCIKNKLVNAESIRSYFNFITDVKLYPENNKKITIISKQNYILTEIASGDFDVLPKHIYDKKGELDKYSIPFFNEKSVYELNKLKPIVRFSKEFNSEKFSREIVNGSGPYDVLSWIDQEEIILKKKNNWWGERFKNDNYRFEANPNSITYKRFDNDNFITLELINNKIDVYRNIPPEIFQDLLLNKDVKEHFNVYTPSLFAYDYIAFHAKSKRLKSNKTRQALAHLIDVDQLIDVVQQGFAERLNGPIHPLKQDYSPIDPPYEYSIDKAKQLLKEDGWTDSDSNGVLDKMFGDSLLQLELDFKINIGNKARKTTALMFQHSAEKAGAKVNIVELEYAPFLNNLMSHNFDITYGGFISNPLLDDFMQVYHTSAYDNGSNFFGFGNKESDEIISKLRYENDIEKRKELNLKLTKLINEDASICFLYIKKGKILINKKYTNTLVTGVRPGYWEAGFVLKKDSVQ